MKRTASAAWTGGLKDGRGHISTESGTIDSTPFGFNTRFENTRGTNPEELIGAAHAACFSMALSAQLEEVGKKAESIETNAAVTLEKQDDGYAITAIHLTSTAKIPGMNQQEFETIANKTKVACPVYKVLNANITLSAKLHS